MIEADNRRRLDFLVKERTTLVGSFVTILLQIGLGREDEKIDFFRKRQKMFGIHGLNGSNIGHFRVWRSCVGVLTTIEGCGVTKLGCVW